MLFDYETIINVSQMSLFLSLQTHEELLGTDASFRLGYLVKCERPAFRK